MVKLVEENKKKELIYMRCSTDEDRQQVDTQLDKCISLAKHLGAEYEVVREYSSAWNKKRPKFKECLERISNFDIWISYNLDRFTRDSPHVANEYLNYVVHKQGVRFITVIDNMDSENDLSWNILRHLMVWYANWYSNMLSSRIKDGIKFKVKRTKGKYKHGKKRKVDYNKIRQLYKKGMTISKIARKLNCNKSSVFNAIKGYKNEKGYEERIK